MKAWNIATIPFVAATLFAGQGAHADQGLTREQVRQDLLAAQAAGDVPAGFAASRTMADIHGHPPVALGAMGAVAAPALAPREGKTREEVRDELFAAQRAGEMPLGFAAGLTYRDVFAGRYPERAERGMAEVSNAGHSAGE